MTIDGSLYYLPGYLTLAGFFYNKDLFAEHGWEAPQSLEELIALNEQAKAEGIRLMAYSMELTGQRFLQLTNIASAQFLHTPQGRLGNRIILRAKRAWWARSSLSWTSIGFGSTAD